MTFLPAASFFRLKFDVPYHEKLSSVDSLKFSQAASITMVDKQLEPLKSLEFQLAWNAAGLGYAFTAKDVLMPMSYEEKSLDDSEYFELYIDTRNSKGNHRANQFCHAFRIMPHFGPPSTGKAKSKAAQSYKPAIKQLEIAQATKSPGNDLTAKIELKTTAVGKDGYRTEVWHPGECLNGYAPDDQPELGFCLIRYCENSPPQALGAEFMSSLMSDPSVWHVLKLSR